MRTRNISAVFAAHLSRRRISRVLAVVLSVTLLQITAGIESPVSYAVAGNVGSTTSSGSCSSAVGEQDYVTASFNSTLGFCLIKFNSGTTWTVPSGVIAIDVLVVGGGGGGGSDGGGGGGGGEVRVATGIAVTANNSATITVGAGGIGNIHGQSNGTNGGASSIVVNGTTVTASGGLKSVNWQPAEYYAPGGSGGSGGTQVTGATNYSKGGRNSIQTPGYTTGFGTVGYDGVSTTFTGPSTVFAGGGGGGICTNTKSDPSFGGLAGGAGGGGRGALHTKDQGSDAGQPGTDGLGGGGGGGSACNDGGTDLVNARTAGGSGGKGVVYVKYVPYIFLATDPQPITVAIGGTATFSSVPFAAITGPTRTKKWQVLVPGGSWTDIANTDSDTLSISPVTRAMQRNQYRYVVTDTVGNAVSATASVAATLTVPAPLLYGETDTAMTSSAPTTGYTTSAGADEITPSSSDAFTIEAWIYPTNACSVRCTIAAREGAFRLTYLNNKISFVLWNASSAPWQDLTVGYMPLNQWAHVALVRNGTSVKVFINSTNVASYTLTYAPNSSLGSNFYVASINTTGSEPFFGSIDELRVWKSDRSSSLASDMNSNETSTSTLAAYWNFNEGTGTTAYNRVPTATSATDFTLYSANFWDATVVSSVTTSGVYTTRTFKRTYLTINGGWKVPAGVIRTGVLVVGGGGGGGGQYTGSPAETAGSGGGGGVYEINSISTTALASNSYITVTVGAGGFGGGPASDRYSYGKRGGTTYFGAISAGGGGGGTRYDLTNQQSGASGLAGGGGGGGSWYLGYDQFGSGGSGTNLTIDGVTYSATTGGAGQANSGNTGAAGGGAGGAPTSSGPGPGIASVITGETYGRGGTSKAGTFPAFTFTAAKPGNGGDGYQGDSANGGYGANGANGLVAIKYITAAKPIFTQPSNDTTTAGLTDTITVSADPISPLTRSYRWQFSTDTGTTWANISTGSGFTSQTYTTPILETATSGIRYQYRVVVTDSDTAGLFIVDTSTAVYNIINPRIEISGSYTAQKYGAAHTDTFTVVSSTGTGNKIFTVSPNNRSGITWNVATANQATLTIASSVGPGTYYDTMTATDTKGAQTQLSVAIVVNKADTLTVYSGTKFDTYTGTTLTFTPTFSIIGFVNGDTATSVTYEYNGQPGTTYPKSTTKPINAGSYVITPTAVIPNSDSYTAVKVIPSALIVYRALRTISIDTLTSTLKYGSSASLSATPSAGAGDGTISFSTAQTDSCTVAAANLQAVKSSGSCVISAVISQGANYETATATTKTVTLAKADTITVQVRNPVTAVYSPTGPTSLPTLTVSGLVLSDTATSTRLYSAPGSGSTCATGGACALGDTGPGGGIVFYDAGSNQSWGRYLEAAPANWVGVGQTDSATVNVTKWCVSSPSIDAVIIGNLPDGIGQGYANTYSTSLNCTGGAIYRAKSYRGGGKADWYLPTGSELALMATPTNRTRLALVDLFSTGNYWGYWGSNENSGGSIGSLVTQAWGIGATNKNELTHNYTRPIRAFAGGSYTYNAVTNSSTVPTDVENWTVSASTLTFSVGSATNYEGIVYETSTLTITQANQTKLGLNLYGAVAGSPFTLQISGGSGTGALTQTIAAGSTASNCAVSNAVLSNSNSATDQKTCNVIITKADDRNYKLESLTATIYFMVFINDQPTQVGSGSTIGLNGVTSYTVDTTSPPTITSLSATTISIGAGGTLTINGTGFTGNVIVRFYRNKPVTPSSSSSTALTFNVAAIGSAGATTGRITVITDNGQAVSTDTLVINP